MCALSFKRLAAVSLGFAMLVLAPMVGAVDQAPSRGHVLKLVVDGPISPASAAYIERGLQRAQDKRARAVLLQLDTPGGLSSSMRDIIKSIMASPVPVIGYVAPSGSRAASAGTYILYACQIAAMAPATNLGAATPVQLLHPANPGSSAPASATSAVPKPTPAEGRKVLNDAVAYIQSLAKKRGRNADWAEQAVREAVSLDAESAVEKNVVDLIAPNDQALLEAVDGRTVRVGGDAEATLHTAGADIAVWQPDWRIRFLGVIANPSVAYLLLLIGIVGLLLEGMHPGAVVPGVVGAISLLLALYALQLLPVNFAGLALMVLGVLLMVAEAFVPSFGALGLGGVVSFVVGSVVLMDTGVPGFGLPLPLLVGVALAVALLMAGIVWMALRSVRQPQVSGAEEMVGMRGNAAADFIGKGRVHVHGEYWQARCDVAVQEGQAVRVVAMRGLILDVVPESESTGD